MRRILVTGALGNVGREVVRECLAAGFSVRAAGQSEQRLREGLPGAEPIRFDFRDRSTWPAALSGCDGVFLLRPPPIGDMENTLLPFVDAAYAAGAKHVVFLSVMGADRMKWVPHRKVELHLASVGTQWTILRPGFFAQNFQDAYLADIREDDRLYVPAGSGRVAFIDVGDAAAVCARIFEEPQAHQGKVLTLTGPTAITFDEAAAALSQSVGRAIRYVPAGIFGYARHLRVRRKMSWMQIAVQTVLHVGLRRGDAERVDPTLRQLLGRDARTFQMYANDHAALWATSARGP